MVRVGHASGVPPRTPSRKSARRVPLGGGGGAAMLRQFQAAMKVRDFVVVVVVMVVVGGTSGWGRSSVVPQ